MIQWLNGNETDFLIRLGLSFVIGFVMGIEREHRGKSAGISTHSFVIAGAMLFTMISMAIEPTAAGRIAANIVVGIGFLGAGMIFRETGERVANLTTAANIWLSAAIGMALGFGWYVVAIMAAIYAIAVPQIHDIYRQIKTKKN